MSGDGMAELRAALKAEPPAGLAVLDDADLRTLAAAVHEARVRQADELRDAADRALRIVPRVLRGPVRKALWG